jgi:uncharacterized protein YxeA
MLVVKTAIDTSSTVVVSAILILILYVLLAHVLIILTIASMHSTPITRSNSLVKLVVKKARN